jgi:hypothetical protein
MAAVLRADSKAAPQRAAQAAALAAVLGAEQALAVQEALEVAEVLAMVVVAGAALAADVSYFSTTLECHHENIIFVISCFDECFDLG